MNGGKHSAIFYTFFLLVAILLLVQGTGSICPANKIIGTNTSTFEEYPDLTILGVEDFYDVAEGGSLVCVFQNIGTAPTNDYRIQTDGYIGFGLLRIFHSDILVTHLVNPGDIEKESFYYPSLFIGILRVRCHISTSIPEEDDNNNRFAHSYFIVNLNPFWFFKELPF
jgi:hypothetical protein